MEPSGDRKVVATLLSGLCPQLFARAEVTLPVIQVIGRWGSLAIWRYVQDSVFCPTKTAALVRFSGQAVSSEFRPSTTPSTGFDEAAVSALVHRVVAASWQSKATVVHHTSRARTNSACRVLTGLLLVAGGTTAAATTLDTRPSCQGFQGAPSVLQVRPSLVR